MPPFGAADDVRWVFVTGAHKSGTTWIERMLVAHPEIFITGEAWMLGDNISSGAWLNKERFQNWANQQTVRASWMKSIDVETQELAVQRAMIESQMRLRLTPGIRVLGDRGPLRYLRSIAQLHNLFPDATILHAIRDGRDVAVSYHFHMLRDNQPFAFDRRSQFRKRQNFYIKGEGRPVPLFTRSSLRVCAERWKSCVEGGEKGRLLYGGRYFELRYERLLGDPFLMVPVFEHLGVDLDESIIDHCIESNRFVEITGRKPGEQDTKSFVRKGVTGDWKNHFCDSDRSLFNKIAGETLIESGYAESFDW